MKRIGNFEELKVAGSLILPGSVSWIAHAYRTSDIFLSGGSVQNITYTHKVDPNSILNITGGMTKFTVPNTAQGIVRVKTKLSVNSGWNGAFYFSLPIIYRTSDNAYMGAGDRVRGNYAAGENSVGHDFPSGEAFFNLSPGVEYTIRVYSSQSGDLTGGTNGNGDVNYTVVEIW